MYKWDLGGSAELRPRTQSGDKEVGSSGGSGLDCLQNCVEADSLCESFSRRGSRSLLVDPSNLRVGKSAQFFERLVGHDFASSPLAH